MADNVNDFQILRVKGPDTPADVDAADPDWAGLQLHPNTGYWTVGGTADDGVYSLTFTRVGQATGVTVGITADATGGDTNSDIATALRAAIETASAKGGTLHDFVAASSVSTATLALTSKQTSFKYVISSSAPGTGTLLPLGASGEGTGTLWPITAVIPYDRRVQLGPNTDVELCVVAIDSSGDPVDLDSGTYTLEVVERIPVPAVQGVFDAVDMVGSRGEVSGTFGAIVGVQLNGTREFGVRFSSITEASSTDRIIVLYRAVVA